ncbi:MAG: tripartite tricarboxylate transporter substrate binding protein [Pseudomonadota bacterium]
MRSFRLALAAGLLGALTLQAGAQNFPDRPIRLIVPYGTGGITDIVARIVAPAMGDQLGQQIFVDNRAGAAGIVGFGATANAPADGYTLVLATTALAANPILFKSIPYDARKSFTPISMVGVVPMVAVVPSSSPAKTLKELVELARTKSSETNYGSAGNGSDNHLTAENFNYLAGIKVTHVPYRGGGQVMTDLVAGRLSYVFATMPTALPFIGDGRLRALATTGQERSKALPDVPTVAETMLPGFSLYAWLGLFGPANLPPAVGDKLNKAAVTALSHPDTIERLRKIGLEIKSGTSQELGAHLDRELNRWAELAKHVKIEVTE